MHSAPPPPANTTTPVRWVPARAALNQQRNSRVIEDLAGAVRDAVPTAVLDLLARNDINPSDGTVMPHQGSRVLMDHWQERVRPKAYPDTLVEHSNMTLATCPVNPSYYFEEIETPYTVIVAVACGLHVMAVLFRN